MGYGAPPFDPVNASIGIARSAVGESSDDLVRNADVAMYEAKRAGRGRWVLFDDSMHERVVRATALENDLRLAIRGNQFALYYQAQMNQEGRIMILPRA